MERRLAAIMAADVVGYSRLIRADEEGTLVALKDLRADLIEPTIAEHNGRIVKLMGDGILAEFASVVDAVRAAVETQQAVTDHNSGLPEDKRIQFRVGINPAPTPATRAVNPTGNEVSGIEPSVVISLSVCATGAPLT